MNALTGALSFGHWWMENVRISVNMHSREMFVQINRANSLHE